MKVVGLIKKVFMIIFLVVFFTFTIGMTVLMLNGNKFGVTQFGDTALVILKNSVSSKTYKKGDLVLVEQRSFENIKKGDEIFVYKVNKDGTVGIDFGIIGETYKAEDAISFESGATYSMDFVAGAATKVYNNTGMILSILLSRWGFLFIVLVPNFLIFVNVLSALIAEIKYGKDEAGLV